MRVGVVINVSIPGDVETTRHLHLKLVLEELAKQLQFHDRIVMVCDACGSAVESICEQFVARLEKEHALFGFEMHERQEPVRAGEIAPDGRPWRLASSRNIGVQAMPLDIDIFAFLDADCVPAPQWREKIGLAMEAGGPRVLFGRTDLEGPRGSEDITPDPRKAYVFAPAAEMSPVLYRSVALFERGGGGNMAISSEVWEILNGFDQEFDGGFGYEETELACRAFNRGFDVFYAPEMHVLHKYHPREPEHLFNLDRNRRLFIGKTGLSAFSREAR